MQLHCHNHTLIFDLAPKENEQKPKGFRTNQLKAKLIIRNLSFKVLCLPVITVEGLKSLSPQGNESIRNSVQKMI